MRNLSAAALAQIAENLGNEPIYIIEIQWTQDGGISRYADRDIPNENIKGQILQVGELDAVATEDSDSQALAVVLDDKGGTIKTIMDTNDIHKRDARVYQWFEGLALDDKFLLFRGQISSPITWSEADRTISFSIISQIEDKEFGFSPEEGQFSYISNELIGVPWPICFGTTTYTKALRLTAPQMGITADGIGLADPAIPAKQTALLLQIQIFQQEEAVNIARAFSALFSDPDYGGFGDERSPALAAKVKEFEDKANTARVSWLKRQTLYDELEVKRIEQQASIQPNFRIFDALRMPSGTIDIKVGDITLTGYKNSDSTYFIILERHHPKLLADPDKELPWCDGSYRYTRWDQGTGFYRGPFDGNDAWRALPWTKGDHDWGYYYIEPGTPIVVLNNEAQTYIVSLTPGTVKNVSTMMRKGDQSYLVSIPQSRWTQSSQYYGSVTAQTVLLYDALSKDPIANYSDDIYVTFESTVGPNLVDIMTWTISNYTTGYTIDGDSFSHVRGRVSRYPCNFNIQKRINVLEFLHEIAWQGRCQLRLIDNTFYLTYLPEVPTSVATVTESDIDVGSFEIVHTPTENLVTKMICHWTATGAQEEPNRVILRHNVAKYGVQEQTYDFYIYDNADLVIKSATFWLIRNSNTWKIASFTTPLNLLNVETEDGVTLAFSEPYISNGPIVTTVKEASYDSENRSIKFQCWTGVKAGQMDQYDFAYPADVDSTLTFPTPEEVAAGFDGGWGSNKNSFGTLGDENLDSRVNKTTYYGGSIGRRRYQDKGDYKPSDNGDSTMIGPIPDVIPILSVATPGPDTGQLYISDEEPALDVTDGALTNTIDIHATRVYDSVTGETCMFSSFFPAVNRAPNPDGQLTPPQMFCNTNIRWVDSEHTAGVCFAFQYEPGGEDIPSVYGTSLAFLYDDNNPPTPPSPYVPLPG